MKSFKNIAIEAADKAGHFLREHFGNIRQADIESKEQFDFVTHVDKGAEDIIIKTIHERFPEHQIFAEESQKDEHGEFRWIIDPLDGTTNYIHGVPTFCVSIGLEHNGEMIVGVVYDPIRDEWFVAEKAKGAFLNDQRIRVSDIADPQRALLATGYPFRIKSLLDVYQESFKNLFLQVSGIRRAGSAAIDLCYIACGRYDGFWELDLSPWDIAAAWLILEEAGGTLTDFAGGRDAFETGNTIASNSALHPFLLENVQHAFKGIVEK